MVRSVDGVRLEQRKREERKVRAMGGASQRAASISPTSNRLDRACNSQAWENRRHLMHRRFSEQSPRLRLTSKNLTTRGCVDSTRYSQEDS